MQSTNIDLSSGSWAHLMMTIDKTSSNVSLYKNGVKIAEHTGVNLGYSSNILKENMLLGSSLMSGNNFNGYMDDFTIFDGTLTESNVRSVYESYTMDNTPRMVMDTWQHVAANYDSIKKEVELYINGSNIGKYENYQTTTTNNSNPIVFGDGFVGELGEVAIYERPLSKIEIEHMYNDTNRHLNSVKVFEANFQKITNELKIFDSSTFTNDATLAEQPFYMKGHTVNSKALIFTGSQSATISDNRNYNSMLFNIYFKHDNSRVARLIKKGSVFEIQVDTNGTLKFLLEDNSTGTVSTYVSSAAHVIANEMLYLSIKFDKFESVIKIYKGTSLVETINTVNFNLSTNSTSDIVFGSDIIGAVSEIALFSGYKDSVLSDTDYNKTTVLASYSFDESGGSQCLDNSEYANNGIIVNGAQRMYGTFDPQSKGIRLDQASEQYVYVGGNPYKYIDLNTMTISAWISPRSTQTSLSQSIIMKANTFSFDINSTGNLEFKTTNKTYTSTSQIDAISSTDIINKYFIPGEWVLLARQTRPITVRTTNQWMYENWNEDNKDGDNFSIIPELNNPLVYNAITKNGALKYHMMLIYYRSDGTKDIELEFKQTSHPFLSTNAERVGGELIRQTPNNTRSFTNTLAMSESPGSTVWDASGAGWYYPVGQVDTGGIPSNTHSGTECHKYECYIYIDKTVNISGWTHVAVALDEYNETVKFYKNGLEIDNIVQTNPSNIQLSDSALAIGHNFTGDIDNVIIHKGLIDFNVDTSLYTPSEQYRPQKITKDEWVHVAAVYDKSKNMVSMYQNGNYIGCYEDYLKEFKNIGSNSNNMFIATTGDTKTFYEGMLDDIRIYDRTLKPEEILDLFGNKKQELYYIDRSTINPVFKITNDIVEVDVGVLTISIPGMSAYTLKIAQNGGNMGPTLLEDNTAVRFTWYSWEVMTFSDIMVETTELGKIYEFEYKEQNQGTSGYMILGLSITNTPGTGWSPGATVGARLLLNWHGSLSRYDGYGAEYTTFENGSAKCEFWRFTVVEHKERYNTNLFRDILYEGFTSEARTPQTRTIWGYASRMYHGHAAYETGGEVMFKNNQKFYLTLGGHHTGTGYFRNFKVKKSIKSFAVALETDRLQSKADMLFFVNNIDKIPSNGYFYKDSMDESSRIKLNNVLSTNLTSIADVSTRSHVYVNVAAIADDGTVDFIRQKVNRTYPPVSLSLQTVIDDTSTPSVIRVVNGHAASVKQYFILAFVGQPSFDDVKTFVQQTIYNLSLSLSIQPGGSYMTVGTYNNQVYTYKTNGLIPTLDTHEVDTTITLSKAFATTDIDKQPINISTDTVFTTYIIGIDMYGAVVSQEKYYDNKLMYDNKNIMYTYITDINMNTYNTHFVVRGKFLFTYTATTIKVFKQEYNRLTEVLSTTTSTNILNVSQLMDLPYVVYVYNADGYAQFKILHANLDDDIITDITTVPMTSGEQITGLCVVNEDYMVFKSTLHKVCIYQFDKINRKYNFIESFNTFSHGGVDYTIDSTYGILSNKNGIMSESNVFMMKASGMPYEVYVFQYNGTSWNNVKQIIDVIDTDGTSRYIIPVLSTTSYDGTYLFFEGFSNTYLGAQNVGMIYIYKWNGTKYINQGLLVEKAPAYNHFGSTGFATTKDNRLLVVDYASRDAVNSGNYRAFVYGYTFDEDGFNFESSTELYRTIDWASGNTYAIFNFAVDNNRVFVRESSGTNAYSMFMDIRKVYNNPYESRPYPPRSWTTRPISTTSTASFTSPSGISIVNTAHPSTHTSTWTLPETYVSYGAGTYIAKSNRNYNNSGHYPAGAFLKINRGSPCFHTETFTPTTSNPFIATLILPISIHLTHYDIHCRDPATTLQGPVDWVLEASNDEFVSEIVALDTQTAQRIVGGTNNRYYVENSLSTNRYTSYRINIYKSETTTTVLAEIEFWGTEVFDGSNGSEAVKYTVITGTPITPTPLDVLFDITNVSNQISINTGTITVGTYEPITKLTMIVATQTYSDDSLLIFFNNSLKALSTSTQAVYINNTTYLPNNVIDMTTLGINITKSSTDLVGSTSDILDGQTYHAYMFVQQFDTVHVYKSDSWRLTPTGTKYRISMLAIDDTTYFRGPELAFINEYQEPNVEYGSKITYTTTPSSYNTLSDVNTVQSNITSSIGYRTIEIEYPENTILKQIYVGSTDSGPHNNMASYDKEIKIEVWNGTAYVPHSQIIWETLPDENGITRATSSDNYFPWQPVANKNETNRIYPLIGYHGKQILRFNPTTQSWYHYMGYGNDNSSTYPKTADIGNGSELVY